MLVGYVSKNIFSLTNIYIILQIFTHLSVIAMNNGLPHVDL